MNGEEQDRYPTVWPLIRALELQDEVDDGRDELLASLRRIGDRVARPQDATVAGILDLLGDSSLGAVPSDVDVDPAEIARVLDRLDAAEREPEPVGAVEAWSREFVRLCRTAARSSGLLSTLAERGVLTGEMYETATRPARFAGRTLDRPGLAERIIEAFGESWEESGFRGLYLAALRTRAGFRTSAVQVSGISGSGAVDRDAARARIEAAVDDLPVLRGRDRVVAGLVAAVERGEQRVQVLTGPGGYGKSTVALAVAKRVRSAERMALRLPASDLDELVEGLYLAAVSAGATVGGLELALRAAPAERPERLWTLLDASPDPWLIVLDDVGPDIAGHPALTRGSRGGTVLLTTRHGDRNVWAACDVIRLDHLSPAEGGLVVLDRIEPGHARAGRPARELSRALDGVPLALTSAGRLVSAAPAGPSRLDDLAERIERLHAANPVSAVYQLGVGAGRGASGEGRRTLVRLLACFAPDEPLPLTVLDGYTDVVAPRPLLPDLVGTGLVQQLTHPSGWRCITIHPALAEESRRDSAIQTSETAEVTGQAIALLRLRFDDLDAGAPAIWPLLRMLEPHVAELLASPALGVGELLADAVRLAERTASALLRSGDQAAAKALLADAERRGASLPERHPSRLALRHTGARVSALDGGDFAHAERELREVLELRSAVLGERHLDTLSTLDCLSWVIAERGAPEQAREMIADVLADRRELLGETHPHTMSTRHRLAWVDGVLGRERAALGGLAEVLEQRRARLGEAHLDVYSTRYRLAWALARISAYADAEDGYRELQAELERVVGPQHPLALMVRVRVGWVLVWRNRLDEAERHYRDVLADQEKVLGADHLRVLRTRHLMGCVALQRGDVVTAMERLRPVVAIREEMLGPDHPHTLYSRAFLAWAWLQAGQTEAADRELQAIVADRQRVLGVHHPVTMHTRYLLARARIRRGRLDEAQRIVRGLLDDQRDVLPPEHSDLLDTRHTLAVVNGRRGRLLIAERELRALLTDRIRLLGSEHRETLATRDYLAWVLGRQRRIDEGLEEARAVLDDRSRVLGRRHPHTLTSRYRLAWLVAAAPDLDDDAAVLFTALLDDLRDVLGDDHPDTLRCRHALVRLRREAGDAEAAAERAEELLADQVRVRGEDAVDTLRIAVELGRALSARPGREAEGEALLDDVHARMSVLLGDDHPDTVRLRKLRRGEDPGEQ